MRQLANLVAIMALAASLLACSGGDTQPGTTPTGGPLAIALFAASPSLGGSPLVSTITVNITGGEAPYVYAWDFENDGAFDRFDNGVYAKTLSATNTYYFRSSDAGGVSTYEALLKVTDNLGATITTTPITLLVQGTQDFHVVDDPAFTFTYSDVQNPDGSYTFGNNAPVYFQATVTGGVAPFNFQWDFGKDGTVDSSAMVQSYSDPATGSASNSRQWAFSNNQPGAKTFISRLTVTDGHGATALYDYVVIVDGTQPGGPPPPEFDIILNTSPSAAGGTVTLKYDPTGADPNLPPQPLLDMSVTVNPDPTKGGVPPYEYYWDFENDGALDSQAPSPTIPYYNQATKLMVNPYILQQDEKTFTLEVMVIDSSGQVQVRQQSVRVIRATGRPPGVLAVDVAVDADGNGNPFMDVPNSVTPVPVEFNLTFTGSTGVYQWQLDVDGDGTPDLPTDDPDGPGGNPPVLVWGDVSGDTDPATPEIQSVDVTFGPYIDDDNDPNTPNIALFDSPGYWPCIFHVRSLTGVGGSQEDAMQVFGPVSLVERSTVDYDGNLTARTDHGMAAFWDAQTVGGAYGQSLVSREIVIVGGAVGTSQLKNEERLTQFYSAPLAVGEREAVTGSVTSTRIPHLVPRRGAAVMTDGTDNAGHLFMCGGRNNQNGVLANSESHAFNDAGGTAGWLSTTAELISGEYLPVYDALATNQVVSGNLSVLCGGITRANDVATPHVNTKTIVYVYQDTTGNALDDVAGDIQKDMLTPRYDGVCALTGVPGVNGRLYAIGGRVASGQSVSTVEYLDMSSANVGSWFWVPAPSMLEPRSGHTAQVINGRIYVLGGAYFPSDEANKTLLVTAEVFDPNTGQWSHTLAPSTATYAGASAAMPGPGSVSDPAGPGGVFVNTMMYFGGEGAGGETNLLEEFRYFYTVP